MTSLTATFTLPRPPDEVWPLFTARGECRWVEGWEPAFPGSDDDQSPGTVFTTTHAGLVTTWIVTAAEPGSTIAYARVTPNDTAGTVVVTCRAAQGQTEIAVTYTLTALAPDAAPALRAFASNYPHFIDSWRQAILASTGGGVQNR